jgi:hypothetical protein
LEGQFEDTEEKPLNTSSGRVIKKPDSFKDFEPHGKRGKKPHSSDEEYVEDEDEDYDEEDSSEEEFVEGKFKKVKGKRGRGRGGRKGKKDDKISKRQRTGNYEMN